MRRIDQQFIHTIIDASVIDAGAEAADFKGSDVSPGCALRRVGRTNGGLISTERRDLPTIETL